MGEFFKGWKRKCGVVTVLMACVFMVGWLRSLVFLDTVSFPIGIDGAGYLSSFNCNLSWQRTQGLPASGTPVRWSATSLPIVSIKKVDPVVDPALKWRWKSCGFSVSEERTNGYRLTLWTIPYWSIVIPMTLLSTFLLLSKPRQSTQKKTVEPIPEAVT